MEQYFCDSAAEWTDNPGNELRRADGAHALGRPAGQRHDADPGPSSARRTTPTARRCATTTASATPKKNYREQYVALRAAHPELRNRMYGHAVEAERAPVAAVLVLLLLQRLQPGARDRPARGRLGDGPAAHARRRARPRRLRPAPPGREAPVGAGRARSPATPTGRWSTSPAARTPPTSSPASTRPRPGTTSPTASATRRARRSRSSTDDQPPWIAWPGVWGDTRARVGGIDQPSPQRPVGPRLRGRTPTARWPPPGSPSARTPSRRRRSSSRATAAACASTSTSPGQPGPPAASLQVTVNSRDEAGVPPRTYTFQLAQTRRGTLATEVPLDPAKHYDVYASTTERRPADPLGVGPHRARPGGQGGEAAVRRALWASSGAWWPASAASSGAEHPLAPAHLAPR